MNSVFAFLILASGLVAASQAPSTHIDAAEQPERTYVQGTVYDAATRSALTGASVVLTARNRIVATDQEGHFRLEYTGVEFPLELRITYIGYEEKVKTVAPRDTVRGLSIYLEAKTVELGPITVVSHRLQRGVSDTVNPHSRTFMSVDSGEFLRFANNTSGIRRGGFGIDPVMRGMSGNRLNVRVDGLATTAAACPNRMDPPTSHIRLTDVEQVEIHHGPHALQYGPSFGGTINFVRVEPGPFEQRGWHGDLTAGFESNTGRRKTDVRLMAGDSRWNVMLTGGLAGAGTYVSGSGQQVGAGFTSYDYSTDATWHMDERQRVYASWGHSFVRDALFPGLMMDMARDDTRKFKAGYRWQQDGHSAGLSVSVDGYWNYVDHEMNNHNRPMFDMRDAVALAETSSYGLSVQASGPWHAGSWRMRGSLDRNGVTGTRHVAIKMGPMAGQESSYNLWQGAEVINAGLYAGTEQLLGDWVWSLGARIDRNAARSNDPAGQPTARFVGRDMASDHWNVSLSTGLLRTLGAGRSLGLYIGRGVRSPDVTERYINYLTIGRDGYEYVGNPDLHPESNYQADLVFTHRYRWIRTKATVFGSLMYNYISAVADPLLQRPAEGSPPVREFRNRGDALFAGFEWEMHMKPSHNAFVVWQASYTHAEYRDNGGPVAEIPPLETSLTAGRDLLAGRLSPELTLRKVFAQERYDAAFDEQRTPSFWLFDGVIRSSLPGGIVLATGVHNLFDEAYHEHLNRRSNAAFDASRSPLQEPGRRFFVELAVSF